MITYSSDISSPSGCIDCPAVVSLVLPCRFLGYLQKLSRGHHTIFQYGALPSWTKEPDDWRTSGVLLCSSSAARPALMPRPCPCDPPPLGGQVQIPDARVVWTS
jgi:hypothetical protein